MLEDFCLQGLEQGISLRENGLESVSVLLLITTMYLKTAFIKYPYWDYWTESFE